MIDNIYYSERTKSPDGLLSLSAGATVLYVLWRIWRFTLCPLLWPGAPKEIPYMIPFIGILDLLLFFFSLRRSARATTATKYPLGHAWAMLTNPQPLLSYAIKHCNGSGEPVSVNVMGQTIYFILSEQDAATVLREPPELSHVEHLRNLLMALGCSPSGVFEMDHGSDSMSSSQAEDQVQPLVLVAEELMRKQLLEKSLSVDFLARALEVLDSETRWGSLHPSTLLSTDDGTERFVDGYRTQTTVSLFRWAQEATMRLMTEAWFGKAIWGLSSTIVDDLVLLEHDIWKLLFKLPRPYGVDARRIRARLQCCLVQYIRLPPTEREDASWAVKTAINEMKKRRLSEDDMAAYLLMVLWGSNANVFKTAFWLVAHVTSDSALLESVQAAIDPIMLESKRMNESPSALSARLDGNALLNALYNDTNRISMNSSSARNIKRDMTINGKTFKAGANIIIPYRQLAMSHPELASNWDSFQPDRFMATPALEQSKSFLPFGAGKHKCVGRFLGRRLALMFLASVVHRFDVRVIDGIPEIGFMPVPIGPAGPVAGGDVRVVVSLRGSVSKSYSD